LAGLEKIIRPEDIQQALAATGRVNSRKCTLTHEVMLWVVLAMGLFTDVPIRQVFKLARRLRRGEDSPHRSSLCVARQRLGVEPIRFLFDQVVRPLARPETPGAFYRGLRLMGIDSTVLDVPDSDANAAAFARPSAGERGDGAFPQIRKLSLVELGTHVEANLVVGCSSCGEHSMVEGLLPHLTPEMLLLWDRGFFSYTQWQRLSERKIKVLARVTSGLILRPIRVLLQPEMERRPTRVILQLGRSLTMRKPRKNYTPVEKVAILRRHLIDHVPVSDLCDEYQLSPTLFYIWQKQFFENGASAFERKNAAPEGHLQRTIAALRDKLQRKNEVVAELMEDHIKLKKELGEL
jgi:transposase-like protein